MTNNLKFKALFIAAVILVCIYGIIGIPKSKQELLDNWQKNIRLGLILFAAFAALFAATVGIAFLYLALD